MGQGLQAAGVSATLVMKKKADHNMLCPPFFFEIDEVKIRITNSKFFARVKSLDL